MLSDPLAILFQSGWSCLLLWLLLAVQRRGMDSSADNMPGVWYACLYVFHDGTPRGYSTAQHSTAQHSTGYASHLCHTLSPVQHRP